MKIDFCCSDYRFLIFPDTYSQNLSMEDFNEDSILCLYIHAISCVIQLIGNDV